jgi:hypothetical protein
VLKTKIIPIWGFTGLYNRNYRLKGHFPTIAALDLLLRNDKLEVKKLKKYLIIGTGFQVLENILITGMLLRSYSISV